MRFSRQQPDVDTDADRTLGTRSGPSADARRARPSSGLARRRTRARLRAAAYAFALTALPWAPVTGAAEPGDRCVGIADAAERLACYDAVHGRAARSPGAAPPATAETPPMAPAAAKPAAPQPDTQPPRVAGPERGAAPSAQPRRVEAPKAERNADDDVIAPQRIVASGELATGRRWFRLEDGSLWEQVTLGRSALKVDQEVRVTQGLVGSHHMRRADGGGRSTQVRRMN